MNAFDLGARYYELFANAAGRLEREGPLLLRLLRNSPGTRVLDLACGTGMHALFLAEHGAQVHACDASDAMIAHARSVRPHPDITYVTRRMEEAPDTQFDLALCLGNSLTLLPDEVAVTKTVQNVTASLRDGGLFLVQVLNYAFPRNQQPRCRLEQRTVDGEEIVAVKALAPSSGRTYLTLTYFAGEGVVSEAAVQQNLGKEFLCEAMESAGLTVSEVHGGYDGRAYDPETSPDVLVVGKKA